MFKEILDKFAKEYGPLERFPVIDVVVEGEGTIKDARVIGDNECWEIDEFYQYAITDEKVMQVYYDYTCPYTGEPYEELDSVDYTKAYRAEDVTQIFIDIWVPIDIRLEAEKKKVLPPPSKKESVRANTIMR